MPVEPLYTPREVAALTKLALQTIYKYASSGRIRSLRLGSRLRFKQSDVIRWLRAAERAKG